MIFSSKKLLFRLEFCGRLVYEITSDDFKTDITIGRSSDNIWVLPPDDRSASNHHAKLVFKNKAFFVVDTGSRNGIYYQGQRIQEKKAAPGDLFSIGDCKLIVEAIVENKGKKYEEQYHKLEQLSGEKKGRIYQLTGTSMKIGSASGCSIVIEDSLVSQLHAVIENHNDDTCWVKDMKSRNGTKVNGSPLTEENAETGRMLKDGDIISIAYVDFRFWDKTVTHIRSHLWLKIGVIVATFALGIGGYLAFQTLAPSAKSIRLKAEALAANGNFASAREILQQATTARGADTDAEQRLDLSRKLGIWEKTFNDWNQARKLLSGNPGTGDLYTANDLFSGLISGGRESWQWNLTQASSEMGKAQDTQRLLSSLLASEDWLNKSGDDIEYIKTLIDKLSTAVSSCEKNLQPYQNVIVARARDLISEMKLEIKEYGEVTQTMDSYKTSADTTRIIDRLKQIKQLSGSRIASREKLGKGCSKIIVSRCEKLLFPLLKMQNSQKLIEDNYKNVALFAFAKFKEDIALPSSDDCIVSTNLSLRRAEMLKSNLQLKAVLIQLRNFQTYFRNHNLAPVVNSSLLKNVFDGRNWAVVLTCDALKHPQPSYREKKWNSIYDRFLGVYVFWEFLRSIDGEFDTTIFEERFKPELFQSREIFNHLEVFTAFANPPARLPLHKEILRLKQVNNGQNKLMEYQTIAARILKQRDELVKQMYESYKRNPTRRDGIISGGIALYLNPEKNSLLPKDFSARLNKSLKELRRNLSNISVKSADVSPEQIIQIEKRLLELGIPGDPFIKQAWNERVKRK